MAPKIRPGNQASAQPKSAALPRLQQSPTKQAKKKAARLVDAQPEPSAHDESDEFEHYREWVRRADKNDPEIPLPTIQRGWGRISEDGAAAFVTAVRGFQDAERSQTAVDAELHEVLQKVSAFQYSDESRRARETNRQAESLYTDLVQILRSRQPTTDRVLSRLEAVKDALATMPREGLHTLLEKHQQVLREKIEAADGRVEVWIEDLGGIPHGALWTLENFQKVQNAATGIKNDFPTAGTSYLSPAGSSSSVSKRKRQGDTEESSSKVPRGISNAGVAQSESARIGAARSQQRSSGRATSRAEEQAMGAQPPFQEVAQDRESTLDTPSADPTHTPPSPSDALNNTQPEHAARDTPTEGAHVPTHIFLLPTSGIAGSATALLRDHPQVFPPQVVSWCRRQLIQKNFRNLEDCEQLAEAFFLFNDQTLPGHDWDNEPDVPYLPFTIDDFNAGCWNQALWGNLRRLDIMREIAPAPFQEYYDRNLLQDGWYVENAGLIARKILQLVQRKGLSHDWENETDIVINIPSVETTKVIGLEDLNENGRWNFRGTVGEGGNGRALLYCKYDSAGNLLKRVISKETFLSAHWNSAPFWSGPVANRIPIEAGLHNMLPRNPHIIEYLGFHVNEQLRMVRHYTAFADLGDLSSIYENHKTRVNAVDEHGVALPPPSVPVVAIIYMFQAMAAGACVMAHGCVPDDEGRWPANQPPPWNCSIIHRDIKPQNYFLSSSESSVIWPKIPIVTLGDFGNAIDRADPAFARSRHDNGTPNWMAPEQSAEPPGPYPVFPETNVYQIGLTILHLMHLERPAGQAEYGCHQDIYPRFPTPSLFYPRDLINLAERCIAMNPAHRPTPIDLYKAIRDLATSFPDASSKTIPWQLLPIPPNQPLRTALDQWAV